MRYINNDIITTNIKKIKDSNEVMLVVKDNAYGFGICRVVNIARSLGINEFAVKSINEAIAVRTINKDAEILLLGKSKKDELGEIKKYKIIPTINDYDDYILFKNNNVKSDLAIDIGMNRFGMKDGYLAIINDEIVNNIYIHLHSKEAINKIEEYEEIALKYNKKIHIGGSAAVGKTHSKLRVGRSIYEGALEFYGKIVNIKTVKKGEAVGYDGKFTAPTDLLIGICDIGYSDGLNLFFNGRVNINGNFYNCVGKCCMDQSFIIIDSNVSIGNVVEFFGKHINEDEFIVNNKESRYEMYLNINKNNYNR